MSQLITDKCITSFIKNHFGKTDISKIGDGTVTGALSSLNTELATAYNLVNKGLFTGNYDAVGTSDGLPVGNSICWVARLSAKGTNPFPDVDVNYFELITISDIMFVQIAIVENSTETLVPYIAWRINDSGTWSAWSEPLGLTRTGELNTSFDNTTYLAKKNNLVVLNTNISPGFTSEVAKWWGLATLPTGWRPTKTFNCPALGYQGGWSDPTPVGGMISTNGIIYVYSQSSKLTNYSISTSWFVD